MTTATLTATDAGSRGTRFAIVIDGVEVATRTSRTAYTAAAIVRHGSTWSALSLHTRADLARTAAAGSFVSPYCETPDAAAVVTLDAPADLDRPIVADPAAVARAAAKRNAKREAAERRYANLLRAENARRVAAGLAPLDR